MSDKKQKLELTWIGKENRQKLQPGRGQFQIFFKWGSDRREYQPDFVAETADTIYMLEPKARKDLEDGEVQAQQEAALQWCRHASDHNAKHGGKPWRYLLIPHDAIAEKMSLNGLAAQFSVI
jgi:type III restriction enzyme